MKKYFDDLMNLIKKASFTVPLVLTLVLGFTFTLTHFSAGIDDLPRGRYINGYLFSQGRFSSSLVSYVFGFTEAIPFVEDFTAVVFLFFAAGIFYIIIDKASDGKLGHGLCTAFACLFASYPLINEIFIFNGASLNICMGYFLTGISVLLGLHTVTLKGKKKILPTVVNSLIWMFLLSLYESFAFVYVLAVCIVLLLQNYFSEREQSFKDFIINVAHYVFPLVIGFVIEYIIGNIIVAGLAGSVGSSYSGNTVDAGGIFSLATLKSALYTIFRNHFLSGFWYLPIGIFAACVIISAVMCIAMCIKRKHGVYLVFFAGIYASLFGMGILLQGHLKYRICQTYAVFTAFTIVMLGYFIINRLKKPAVKKTVLALCGVLVFFQGSALSSYFNDDYLRWEEEKRVLETVGTQLSVSGYDIENKPVIFIGEYRLSDNILDRKFVRSDSKSYKLLQKVWSAFGGSMDNTDYDETHVLLRAQGENGSVITFCIDSFEECNTDLLGMFNYLGFEFKQGEYSRFLELKESQKDMPSYPSQGYIEELEDCIVVNFGN